MRPILPALLVLFPALAAAELPGLPVPEKKASAVSMLPHGSELKGVMIPRYDDQHRLTEVLKATLITLVNEDIVSGENVTIGFFNPDGTQRGHIDFLKASINQKRGILQANEPVTLEADRLSARGTGLHYAINQGEGFLAGPVSTRIQAPTETTMNSRPSPLRATALLGMALLSQSIAASPPPLLAPETQEALAADSASAAPAHSASALAARQELRADLDSSAAATAAATAFLDQAELIANTSSADTPQPPAAQPLAIEAGPRDTLIDCDGGMYFDADEGVFVYLRNVRVTDPRFTLTGANELKIYLAKKPEPEGQKPKADDQKPGTLGMSAKFGDVDRIIATGAVRIIQKEVQDGKQPVEASGAIFSYHPKTGQILLSGGYPWVRQGTTFMRANQPNLTLRIQKNGSFVTEGNWAMGGNLERK